MTGVLLEYYRSPRGVPWGTTGYFKTTTEVLQEFHLGTIGVLLGFHS